MATQALERYSPQERALVETAKALGSGIVRYSESGAILIDLSNPELKARYNVLAPASTIAKADPNFTPAISVVVFDSKDFYPTGKGEKTKYALSKVQLDQIALVAGIEDIGPETQYFGERWENVRITFRARMRRPDGTWKPAAGSREWLEADEIEQLMAAVPDWVTEDGKPADKTNPKFNKWWADRWFGQIKRHRLGMTETKARLRAYRELLTVKGGYTKEELAKPFLVPATHFTPNTSDIRILGMLMGQGQEATDLLYGRLPAPEDDAIPGTCTEDPTGEHEPPDFGADPETGEIPTHGERPAEDPVLPQGPHKGEPISQVARTDPGYVRGTLLKSTSPKWGVASEEWLVYWHGSVEEDPDAGMQF